MKAPAMPKNALDHCTSSHMVDVGTGIALRNFRSSIWKAGIESPAYALQP